MAITACTLTHLGPLPAESPNGTSSGIPIGTAFADRLVVILIAGDFTGASLSGAVGGTNLSSDGIASVISAFIPSGTTTTLTVTGGATLPGAPVLDFPICAVYSIAGATSNVPTDVGSALGSASGGTTPMTANIDALSDGAIIAAAGDGGGAGTAFTAGVDSDGTATPSVSVRAGSREYSSGGTFAVTNAGNYAMLVASFAGTGAPTDPPSNTSVPTLSPTKAYIGQAIGGSDGVWTNSPTSYAYRWRLDGTIVSGATSATYTPVSGDEGKKPQKGVIATNAIGSSSEVWSAEGDPITLAPVTTTVNTTGAGSLTLTSTELPNGTGVLNLVEGWGPGAGGPRRGRGSGGGAFAASNNTGDGWPVSVGDTIYWNVGAGAAGTSATTGGTPSSDTWIRISTNAAPTLVSHGALAKAGSAGTSTVNGAGGTTAASIGTTKFAGGAGGNTGSGTTLRGAGGGGAGSAGAGGNASAATQGAAGSPDGGLGGASSTGTSVAAAAAPGGGGGAISGASGNGGTGGNGRVRFTITADGPSSFDGALVTAALPLTLAASGTVSAASKATAALGLTLGAQASAKALAQATAIVAFTMNGGGAAQAVASASTNLGLTLGLSGAIDTAIIAPPAEISGGLPITLGLAASVAAAASATAAMGLSLSHEGAAKAIAKAVAGLPLSLGIGATAKAAVQAAGSLDFTVGCAATSKALASAQSSSSLALGIEADAEAPVRAFAEISLSLDVAGVVGVPARASITGEMPFGLDVSAIGRVAARAGASMPLALNLAAAAAVPARSEGAIPILLAGSGAARSVAKGSADVALTLGCELVATSPASVVAALGLAFLLEGAIERGDGYPDPTTHVFTLRAEIAPDPSLLANIAPDLTLRAEVAGAITLEAQI